MNKLQHLLLKLNEESVEIADAAKELKSAKLNSMDKWLLPDKASDLNQEINDLNSVIEFLNSFYFFGYDYSKDWSNEAILRSAENESFEFWADKVVKHCLEVSKLSSKAMQFGLLERQPELPDNNKQRIHNALNDLYSALSVLVHKFNLPYKLDNKRIEIKLNKIQHYLNYSINLGMVESVPVPLGQYAP